MMQRKAKRVMRGKTQAKLWGSNEPYSRHPHPDPLPKGERDLLKQRWQKALDAAASDREAIDAQARAVFAADEIRNKTGK
jgi:hypothetical protein